MQEGARLRPAGPGQRLRCGDFFSLVMVIFFIPVHHNGK
jgi:hypothetical protein